MQVHKSATCIISVTLHELTTGEKSRTKHYMHAAVLLQKMHVASTICSIVV